MATCCFQRVVILCLSASCFAFPTPHLAGQIVMSSKGNSYNNLTAHAPTQPPFVRDAYGFVTHRYFSFLYSWQKVGRRIHSPAMSFRSAGLSSRSRATRATHSGACSYPLWTASIAFPSCSAQSILRPHLCPSTSNTAGLAARLRPCGSSAGSAHHRISGPPR